MKTPALVTNEYRLTGNGETEASLCLFAFLW